MSSILFMLRDDAPQWEGGFATFTSSVLGLSEQAFGHPPQAYLFKNTGDHYAAYLVMDYNMFGYELNQIHRGIINGFLKPNLGLQRTRKFYFGNGWLERGNYRMIDNTVSEKTLQSALQAFNLETGHENIETLENLGPSSKPNCSEKIFKMILKRIRTY